jgi:hypothetical protein
LRFIVPLIASSTMRDHKNFTILNKKLAFLAYDRLP